MKPQCSSLCCFGNRRPVFWAPGPVTLPGSPLSLGGSGPSVPASDHWADPCPESQQGEAPEALGSGAWQPGEHWAGLRQMLSWTSAPETAEAHPLVSLPCPAGGCGAAPTARPLVRGWLLKIGEACRR